MDLSRSRLVHPATLLALLALLVSLSGTAYALVVTGQDVKDGSLTGKDLRRGTVTGTQVREGSLATVPRARSAATLDGVRVQRVQYRGESADPGTVLLDRGGLRLDLECDGGQVLLSATTTSTNAQLAWVAEDASDVGLNGGSDYRGYADAFAASSGPVAITPSARPDVHDDQLISIRYASTEGDVLQVELTEEDLFGADLCLISGYVVG